jgi:hypothetical protein
MSNGDAAVVRRVDHVNIVVPKPRELFEFLTQRLEIPIERPWTRFPAFESGQAMLGIGHEPITYAPRPKHGRSRRRRNLRGRVRARAAASGTCRTGPPGDSAFGPVSIRRSLSR